MLTDDQTGSVMRAISDRIGQHSQIPGLRYSQAIVNAGRTHANKGTGRRNKSARRN